MTATTTDTTTLTGLDFTPALACELPGHEHLHAPGDPAAWSVLHACPACGRARGYLVCNSGHRLLVDPDALFECVGCGLVAPWTTFVVSCERITGAVS